MSTWITVCRTCKREDIDIKEKGILGHIFFQKICEALQDVFDDFKDLPKNALQLREANCLMNCSRGCNVSIQANDKISYSMGYFLPTSANARALVDFAAKHYLSSNGKVNFKEWPEEIKGHFLARNLPIPE